MKLALVVVLTFAIGTPLAGQELEVESVETFVISGVVVDSEGDPVNGSMVIPLTEGGIPINPRTMKALDMSSAGGMFSKDDGDFLIQQIVGRDGAFQFKLPAGKYRLVAQSWPEAKELRKVLDKNGNRLRIDGVQSFEFANEMEASEDLMIRPIGQAAVRLSSQESSDMLLVSQNPLACDVAVGFLSLTGDFWPGLLCGTRMSRKEIIISGLPEGELQFFSFVNDNNGGIGATKATIHNGQENEVYVGVLAGWSNGHRTPPKELEELTQYFLENEQDAIKANEHFRELSKKYLDGKDENQARLLGITNKLKAHLLDDFELSNGKVVKLREAIAAAQYARMQKRNK